VNWLLPLAVLTNLIPLRARVGGLLVRPFEFLTLLALLAIVLHMNRRELASVPVRRGVLLLLPYYSWHIFCAAPGGATNVFRELAQMVIMVMFAMCLSWGAPRLDFRTIGRIMTWGMGVILAGVAIWHMSHGIITGWKTFAEPRLSFVFFPVGLALYILFGDPRRNRRLWILWFGILPLVLLSGERKAVMIHLFLTMLLLVRKKNILLLPIVMVLIVGSIGGLAVTLNNPYINQQIRTVLNPQATGDYESVIATGHIAEGDTPSNAQRAFAAKVGLDLFRDNPVAGIGTNAYFDYIADHFWYMPPELRISIHGEFLRILVENGVIGILLYALVWIASWMRVRRAARSAVRTGLMTLRQARIYPYVIFMPTALFVGTEASGSRAFIALCVISLLPDLQRFFLKSRLGVPVAPAGRAGAGRLTGSLAAGRGG
jgi:hypothetical protein